MNARSFLVVAAIASVPVGASVARAEDGDAIVVASRAAVASARSLEIEQTQDVRRKANVGGREMDLPPQVQTSTIAIVFDRGMTVRMTTPGGPGGRPLTAIRTESGLAIKLGDDAWQAPTGPFAALADQLADPFACPLPRPGEGSPRWRIAAEETIEGVRYHVVETVGDSAVGYAQARIAEAIGRAVPDAEVTVTSYVSRMWVAVETHRRLKVVQTSRFTLDMEQGGQPVELEIAGETTSLYRDWDAVTIEIPPGARAILGEAEPEPSPEPKPRRRGKLY